MSLQQMNSKFTETVLINGNPVRAIWNPDSFETNYSQDGRYVQTVGDIYISPVGSNPQLGDVVTRNSLDYGVVEVSLDNFSLHILTVNRVSDVVRASEEQLIQRRDNQQPGSKRGKS